MKIVKEYETHSLKLEKFEDGSFVVRDNNTREKRVDFDSTESLKSYKSRHKLSYIEEFLRKAGEEEFADEIKDFMGKTLKHKNVPKLIPTGTYRINQPLKSVLRTIEGYKEDFLLDLDPDFQRAHVWNMEQRVAFVEFLLQGGSTNPIYFNSPNWMRSGETGMVIVDGKQRLTAVMMFLNGEFPIFKELDEEGTGYYYKELDTIHTQTDLVFIINDLPTKKQVLKWYLQMNKGNVAHTKEELEKVEELLKLESINK